MFWALEVSNCKLELRVLIHYGSRIEEWAKTHLSSWHSHINTSKEIDGCLRSLGYFPLFTLIFFHIFFIFLFRLKIISSFLIHFHRSSFNSFHFYFGRRLFTVRKNWNFLFTLIHHSEEKLFFSCDFTSFSPNQPTCWIQYRARHSARRGGWWWRNLFF